MRDANEDETIKYPDQQFRAEGRGTKENGQHVRGRDVEWVEVATFDSIEAYNQSDIGLKR